MLAKGTSASQHSKPPIFRTYERRLYVVCVVRTEYLLMSNLILCYQDVPYLKLNHELFRYEMLSVDQSQPRVVLLCRCGVGFRIPMAISVREEARSPFQAPWMRQASRGVSPQVTGLRPQSIRGQDFVPHRVPGTVAFPVCAVCTAGLVRVRYETCRLFCI